MNNVFQCSISISLPDFRPILVPRVPQCQVLEVIPVLALVTRKKYGKSMLQSSKNTAINMFFWGGYIYIYFIFHSIKARKGMKNLHLYLQTIIRNIPKTFTLQRALLPLLPLNLGVIQQLPAASPAFKKIVGTMAASILVHHLPPPFVAQEMSWWCQRTTSEGGDCDVGVKPDIWTRTVTP